jgi:AcrR family transcriptional regulator
MTQLMVENRENLDSRNLIMAVALKLFVQHGFEGTSIDDIRQAAGFKSKASLYTHFRNKEEVAAALLEKYTGQQEVALLTAYENASPDALSQLAATGRAFIEWALTHRDEFAFCFLRVQQEKLVRGRYDYISGERDAPSYPLMLGVIRRLRADYPVRNIADAALLSMINGVISKAVIDDEAFGNISLTEKREQVLQMCVGVIFRAPMVLPS